MREFLLQIAALEDLWLFLLELHGILSSCIGYNFMLLVLNVLNFMTRGTRASNTIPLHTQCSKGALKKQDLNDEPGASSIATASERQLSSLQSDFANILVTDRDSIVSEDRRESEALGPMVKESSSDEKATFPQSPNTSVHPATSPVNKHPHGPSTTKLPVKNANDVNSTSVSDGHASGRDSTAASNGKMEKTQPSHLVPIDTQENHNLNGYSQLVRGTATSQMPKTTTNRREEVDSRDAQSDFRLGMGSPLTKTDMRDLEYDLLSFENQRLKDPEVPPIRSNFSHASDLSSHSDVNFSQHKDDAPMCSHLDRQAVDKICNFPTGHSETILKTHEINNAEYSNLFPFKERRSMLGGYDGEPCTDSSNMGESSIISNILSIDFDPWDDSLTSPQNLAKLLGENDKLQGSFGVPGSRKNHTSSQSRFSFAREEEPRSQASGLGQSFDCFTRSSNQRSFGHEFPNSNSFQHEKLDSRNGFPVYNGMESEIFTGNHSHTPSNRISGNLLLIHLL